MHRSFGRKGDRPLAEVSELGAATWLSVNGKDFLPLLN